MVQFTREDYVRATHVCDTLYLDYLLTIFICFSFIGLESIAESPNSDIDKVKEDVDTVEKALTIQTQSAAEQLTAGGKPAGQDKETTAQESEPPDAPKEG